MEEREAGEPHSPLAAALAAWQHDRTPAAAARVHAALLGARLLVPLLPVKDESGRTVEVVRPALVGVDGRTAVPAFTGLETLTAWRAEARPQLLSATEVLATAVSRNEAVVLDVAGPVPFPIEGAGLRTLAAGYVPVVGAEGLASRTIEGGLSTVAEPFRAPPGLREALAAALPAEPLVAEAYLLAPERGLDTSDAAVGLVLRADLTPPELVALVRRLADALGDLPGIDNGLDIAVLTAKQRAAALELGPPAYVATVAPEV